MIEAKYAEIRDLVNRASFSGCRQSCATEWRKRNYCRIYTFHKADEDKAEQYKAGYVACEHLDIMKEYLVHAHKLSSAYLFG